jgi:hypothetical protein
MRFVVGALVLVGLLAGASPSQGQDARQFGLTLGVNRVTMQSPSAGLGSYFAAVGGVVVRQPMYGPMSAQAELLLSQKGTEVEGTEGGAINYGAGYLELPVLLHLQGPSVRSVALHAEAGGFGAVKVFERQTPGGDLNVSFDTGASFFRRLDAGIVAGVGAALPLGEQRLNLTVRRVWGLRNVSQDRMDQPFDQAPFPAQGETRAWSLLVRLGL